MLFCEDAPEGMDYRKADWKRFKIKELDDNYYLSYHSKFSKGYFWNKEKSVSTDDVILLSKYGYYLTDFYDLIGTKYLGAIVEK